MAIKTKIATVGNWQWGWQAWEFFTQSRKSVLMPKPHSRKLEFNWPRVEPKHIFYCCCFISFLILISRPYLRPIKSEFLGVGPRHQYFLKLPGNDNVHSRLRTTVLEVWEQKSVAWGFQSYFSFMKTIGDIVRHASTYKIPRNNLKASSTV